MATSYNMAAGNQAWYRVSEGGNTMVSVQSSSPLRFREIYVGTASLEFMWVSSGKSSHWQFTPTILDPTPAQHSETTAQDGQSQIINVELGNKMFPATGLLKTNVTGEIRAPAIHFDLPRAYDLWVILLRSPWFPLKINVERPQLKISHKYAQAIAQIVAGGVNFGDDNSLRVDVLVHGEGLKNVQLSIQRSVKHASIDEILGTVNSGMETFSWKPNVSNFDVVLVAYSDMNLSSFVEFLKYLGAPTKQGFLMASYLENDFLLSDAPSMDYTLRLRGEKHLMGHEEDTAKITLGN